ncbi:MAG: nucleotidyltransferase domain-containing protein [Candidatus Margulisbacteria bacterium]|nr:nucleotidyltransferase domain-containing protein [Candidatus Margulisiibacteriota bacterium]
MDKNEVLEFLKTKSMPEDIKIVYLTQAGSKLYGTDSPESDDDYAGIFIPTYKRLLLKENIDNIKRTTGCDNSKNKKEDIDISLISIHEFFKLLQKGDVTAVDLMFSMLRTDTILFQEKWFTSIIKDNIKQLITKQSNAFVQYCLNHARKNGIKARRLESLEVVYKILCDQKEFTDEDKIALIFDRHKDVLESIDNCKFITKNMNGAMKQFLCIFDKMYQDTLPIGDFKRIINERIKAYGSRSRNAIKNVDFRALSHSCRVICEIIQLLKEQKIDFPLPELDRTFIRKVKLGIISFEEVEIYIEKHLDLVESLEEKSSLPKKLNKNLVDNLIISILTQANENQIENVELQLDAKKTTLEQHIKLFIENKKLILSKFGKYDYNDVKIEAFISNKWDIIKEEELVVFNGDEKIYDVIVEQKIFDSEFEFVLCDCFDVDSCVSLWLLLKMSNKLNYEVQECPSKHVN